jgi:hypothetical protein
VPEDRPASDFDHRLRPARGLFGQPAAFAASEDCDFHKGLSKRGSWLLYQSRKVTSKFRIVGASRQPSHQENANIINLSLCRNTVQQSRWFCQALQPQHEQQNTNRPASLSDPGGILESAPKVMKPVQSASSEYRSLPFPKPTEHALRVGGQTINAIDQI